MRTRPQQLKKQFVLATLLIVAVLAGGWLINAMMNKVAVQEKTKVTPQSIDQHFNQAISYMLEKQYHLASIEWQQLLMLNDGMPEAHVNLGFSQFELGLYQAALDSFNRAMEINPYQANAYYGLAICFEKLGDIPAATGALRSYIHLAQKDDPFVRKARSALWEWEDIQTAPLSEAQADQNIDAKDASNLIPAPLLIEPEQTPLQN